MASFRPLRVGVVGVGHLGRQHARIYAALPGVELVAVADLVAERAHAVAALYGAAALGDAGELIGKVEAASVAVPTSAHLEVARTLLLGGVDLLVEKPLAPDPAAARALVELAESCGRRLMPGHLERFNPALQAAAAWIERPLFLEAQRLSPFTERSLDIDVVLDLMIHDLDLIRHLVGAPVRSIDAVGVAVLSARADIASVRLRFENGCVADLTASRVSPERLRKLRVFQPAGYLSIDYLEQEAKRLTLVGQPGQRPRLETESLPVTKAEPLALELAGFVEAVRRGQPAPIDPRDALEALELGWRIRAAMAAGSPAGVA
jgi:predicted dehydrogenase